MSAATLFVAGAGFMGHGIAQVAAVAGWSVRLYDLDPARLDQARDRIRWSLEKLRQKRAEAPEPAAVLARIASTTELADAADADLVIEAIVENRDAKQALFRRLDALCPPATLFASNTSAIPITRLAAVTSRPDRFCGLHFFAPVPLMALVEVVRTAETSDETVARTRAAAESWGKQAVLVQRDVPGFIVNRLLLAAVAEAARLVEAGVAAPADIDRAMRLGCGYKMGPLETADLSGLDVMLHALAAIYAETGEAQYRPPPLLERLVAAGKLGRKTGEGFYDANAAAGPARP